MRLGVLGTVTASCVWLVSSAVAAAAQIPPTASPLESLSFEPLHFEAPVPEVRNAHGVEVFLLEDHDLPLVTMLARFAGGYGRFDREDYAAAMGLPALMRFGGTRTLSPDSLERALEYYAIQTSFGTGGGSVSSSVNTLSEHLETALDLWGAMLADPGFDSTQIEVWRSGELESVLRRRDDPARLAYSEFNRLLYGEHPVGWEMEASDLDWERVSPERFRAVHRSIACRENLVLGVTGDVTWEEAGPLVEHLVERVPPCEAPLPAAPTPDIRRNPGIFVIPKELEQAVVIMAHPTAVRLGEDPEYFSATIGNSILGAGGFSSRLVERIRTDAGYAYSAASLWTTPRRYDGLVGAVTRTSPENVVPAIDLILDAMEELRDAPPTTEELRTAVDQVVNGFVFNFETPAQIVSRRMFYLLQDLPADWLERYASGVQEVTPSTIQSVFSRHVRPREMTILVVGDVERLGLAELERLGPVSLLDVG